MTDPYKSYGRRLLRTGKKTFSITATTHKSTFPIIAGFEALANASVREVSRRTRAFTESKEKTYEISQANAKNPSQASELGNRLVLATQGI